LILIFIMILIILKPVGLPTVADETWADRPISGMTVRWIDATQ
jgi:hypothetical protein